MTMPPPASDAQPRVADETTGARILLVEDSVTQALQLQHLLQGHGFVVELAPSAEQALDTMNERLPDLVIADYHLPGMNGDGLSRQIRLNMRTRAIPVLMLTEARERDLEQRGLESGADAYVPKSSDEDLLIMRIRALLRQRSGERGHGGPQEGAERATKLTAFRRARLLLVEGGPTHAAVLGELIGREGYSTTRVATARAAVEALEAADGAIDCVIVNVFSPYFDGIALCRELHAMRSGPSGVEHEGGGFLIIAVGGDGPAERETLTDAFAAGADDVVPATADLQVLSLRIRALVRRKLMQDENRRFADEMREREARASLAEAMAQANEELAAANQKLRETQDQLVQAAKMASLGELVAGIAHEINNPLAFILAHQGTVESLVGRLEGVEGEERTARLAKIRERLGSMRIGLQRIQELVLNLRRFSRLDEGAFQTIDVPAAIDTVAALLSHKLGDRVILKRDLQGERKLVCSPALLNQVVMNIIGNAADAIEGEGVITIATRSDAESYTITITDNGPGIPAELRARIFDPFFTTKPVGSGTGLGLSIAYGVVQAHKGTITVSDAPGGGARFEVKLPRRSET